MVTVLLMVGILSVFSAIFIALAAIGVFTNEARGVSKSLVVLEAFAAAPESMKQELDPSFNDRVITPLLARFVGLGKRLTPNDYGERIQHKLDVAGNPPGWTVDRIVSMKVIGIGIGAAVGVLTALLLDWGALRVVILLGLGAVLGYYAPNLYLYQKGYDRTKAIQKAIPDALDLLTISVESGLGFDAALSHVARNTDGPLADEFARVLQEMQIGLGRGAALRALGDRTHVPELKGFVSAMVQADALGIPIAQVLRVQAREIRTKRRQRAEEQAQKVAVKILIPLIFCILPCLFIAVLGPAAIGIMEAFSGRL